MSVAELARKIGQRVKVWRDGLGVYCTVVDVKQSYGTTRYQVEPESGVGSVWVQDLVFIDRDGKAVPQEGE